MPDLDFNGITAAQARLLDQGSWRPAPGSAAQPRPAVAQRLVKRGLLVERKVMIGMVKVTAYDMQEGVREACAAHKERRTA